MAKRRLATVRVVVSGDEPGALAVIMEVGAILESIGAKVELYIGAAHLPQNRAAGEVLRDRRVLVGIQEELSLGR